MDGRESFAAYEIRWATRGQSIPPQLGEGDDAKTLNLEPAGDLNELKLEIFDSLKEALGGDKDDDGSVTSASAPVDPALDPAPASASDDAPASGDARQEVVDISLGDRIVDQVGAALVVEADASNVDHNKKNRRVEVKVFPLEKE